MTVFCSVRKTERSSGKLDGTLEIIKAIQERYHQSLKDLIEYADKLIEITSKNTSP
jgi:hypothetical protein